MQGPEEPFRFVFLDAVLPFAVVIVFCLWQLWALRRSRPPAAVPFDDAPLQTATRPAIRPPHASNHPTDTTLMDDVRKLAWEDVQLEELNPLIGRRLITSQRMMLAHVYLKQGAIVPAHDHHNEQFTYILSGSLRFWIGEHADAPGDEYTDVHAGEVLVIPSHVRHRAEALEDTLDVDVFDPPRQDWLDGSDAYLREQR